ncbi:hypothetical protein GQ457_02G019960 [Hibiscus cannabinus]
MRFSKNISLGELKNEIERKIGAEIVRLRYRWKTCDDLVRYSTIALKDDDDVGLMIAEHDSMCIRTVELHAKLRGRYYDPGPSINVFGSSPQMCFDTVIDDQPYRWGETLVDSSEDENEETIDPDLNDNLGNEPVFSGGSSSSDELSVGKQFNDKEEATLAIKEADCSWKIRVSKLQRRTAWEITKYNGGHTCLRNSINQDHLKLDSDVISRHVKILVEVNPRVTVATIQASVKQQFEYQIKYGKGWYARDKDHSEVSNEECNQLRRSDSSREENIPPTVLGIKPCIEGFPFCKRMVLVDCTWMYGRYKHVMLIVVTQDGDRNIFPIAFAIVESESAESWNFFLKNLDEHVVQEHVVQEHEVCLISDRAASCTEAAQIEKAQEASKQNTGLVFPAAADGRVYQQEGRIKVSIKDLKPKRIKDYLKYKKQPKESCFIKVPFI